MSRYSDMPRSEEQCYVCKAHALSTANDAYGGVLYCRRCKRIQPQSRHPEPEEE